VYSADCFRIHEAIHDRSKTEVKLGSGEVLPVEVASNKCRSVKILGVKFMEQNITKASTYARRAKQGHRITWILQNPRWGMLCDDRIEINCSLINHEPEPVAVKGKKGKGKEAEAGGDAAVKRKASSSAGGESPKKRGTAGDDDGQSSSSSSTAALARSGSTHTLQLSVEFPSYWQPPFAGPREVELEVGGKEFEDLRAMLAKTAERKVDVVRIRRLQSPGLWPQYFLKRKAVQEVNEGKPEKVANMATKLLDPSCNEFQFFHGCSNSGPLWVRDLPRRQRGQEHPVHARGHVQPGWGDLRRDSVHLPRSDQRGAVHLCGAGGDGDSLDPLRCHRPGQPDAPASGKAQRDALRQRDGRGQEV